MPWSPSQVLPGPLRGSGQGRAQQPHAGGRKEPRRPPTGTHTQAAMEPHVGAPATHTHQKDTLSESSCQKQKHM